jgi:hypothetical protein
MPTRRRWLKACSLGAAGTLLSQCHVAAAAANASRAKSVILIFNCGAPSHIDLWDMKPEAPANIRGEFRPIDTSVPGIQISELMPSMVRHAEKLAIVRTVHHSQGSHNAGMYWSIVGRPYPVDSTLINPSRNDYPSFGTLVGWLAQRDGYSGALPPYVITPGPHCDSLVYITPGQYGSCLGAQFDPFVINSDPNSPKFTVPGMGLSEGVTPPRVDERRALLSQFGERSSSVSTSLAGDLGLIQSRALHLMGDNAAGKAFKLDEESPETRERYGRHSWGQSHLLARRLVEAGVRFVSTVNGQSIIWDTHKDNFNQMKNRLVPPMERAYSALLDDLAERGLLDTTLVIWMADFGRTPVINGDAGRDHWPQCYSVVLAGCGIRGGQVVGESDRTGAAPWSRPVTPSDIHATVFSALGYDPHAITYNTADGRPTPLSEGAVISELL